MKKVNVYQAVWAITVLVSAIIADLVILGTYMDRGWHFDFQVDTNHEVKIMTANTKHIHIVSADPFSISGWDGYQLTGQPADGKFVADDVIQTGIYSVAGNTVQMSFRDDDEYARIEVVPTDDYVSRVIPLTFTISLVVYAIVGIGIVRLYDDKKPAE